MSQPSRGSHGAIVGIFFLSGFSGLIYQVVWVRWLTLYVGGSTFAVGTILTVFMAGLAAGGSGEPGWWIGSSGLKG
jgi:spermidine synthase